MKFKQEKSAVEDNIFIGIDQSLFNTGVTVINRKGDILESCCFGTKNDISFEERLISIKNFLFNVILKYNPIETSVAIEGLAFNRKNTNNSAMLFGLFSILLVELCEHGYKYSVIAPTSLKKIATGNGKADKMEMIEKINNADLEKLLKLSNTKKITSKKFEDISDSYWLAKSKLNELTKI